MKLEITHYDIKYTIETKNDDIPTEVMVEHIYNLLVQVGYQPLVIAQELLEKSEEILSVKRYRDELLEELNFEKRANNVNPW